MTARVWILLLTAASLAVGGCAYHGLSFVQDKRITIVEPAENEEVTLPFTVSWTAEDFDGTFVVFFDRSPMRPGRDLVSLAEEDDPCQDQGTCADEKWLSDRNIYVTDETELLIARLPDRRSTDRARDRHFLTIVLLDETGRRSGEVAMTRDFIVERER